MALTDYGVPGLFSKKGRAKQGSLFFGTPEEHERVSTLLPSQMQGFNQLQSAIQGQGAGGAFGTAADYYRSLLGDDSGTYNALAAPELRNFRENIIPELSTQFAGLGSGGLSSSSFRNAAVGAGTDLAERLGAIRAQLRQQGAQGLTGLGQFGLGNFSQDVVTKPGTPGLIGPLSNILGGIAGAYGGPLAGAGVSALGGFLKSKFGQTSPYGQGVTERQTLAGPDLLFQ